MVFLIFNVTGKAFIPPVRHFSVLPAALKSKRESCFILARKAGFVNPFMRAQKGLFRNS